MRHPIVPMVGAFTLGILVAEYLPISATCALIGAGALSALGLGCLIMSRRRLGCATALVLLAALRCTHHLVSSLLPPDHIRNLATDEPKLVRLRGTVSSAPQIFTHSLPGGSTAMRSRFSVRLDSISRKEEWLPVSGSGQVSLPGQLLQVNYGDRVELTAQMKLPATSRNPGESDYRKFLARSGIHVLIQPRYEGNVKVLGGGHGSPVLSFIYNQKHNLKRLINLHFRPTHSRMLRCLLLGERYAIPRSKQELFLRTGTVHLLAISGLHVGIIAGFVWLVTRVLGARRSLGAWFVMVVVISYACIVGPRPSVLRATLMAVVLCLGIIARRRSDFVNTLALTALVILLLAPQQLFQAGFQLSFLAVLGIILFARGTSQWLAGICPLARTPGAARRWYPLRSRFSTWAGRGIAVALIAWVSTVPLSMYYFNIFTPFNVLLNILLIPILWLILVLGILFLLTASLWSGLAFVLSAVLAVLLDVFGTVTEAATRIPGTTIYLPTPPLIMVFLAYLILLGFAFTDRSKLSVRRLAIAALLLVNCFVLRPTLSAPVAHTELTCLDVGQGLSVLVRLPGRFNILYDAGSMSGARTGEHIISRSLWNKDIERLDLLILSHSHFDHINAVSGILDRFEVGQAVIGPQFQDTNLGEELLVLFQRKKIPVTTLSQSDRVNVRKTSLSILGPPPPRQRFPKLDPNDASLVVKMVTQGKSFLLCGDIDEPGIAYLLGQPLGTDVVLVPHHGSNNNNNVEFVEATRPELAVVSANRRFPNRHTLEIYRGAGIQLLETTKGGAITITTEPDGLRAATFLAPTMQHP